MKLIISELRKALKLKLSSGGVVVPENFLSLIQVRGGGVVLVGVVSSGSAAGGEWLFELRGWDLTCQAVYPRTGRLRLPAA